MRQQFPLAWHCESNLSFAEWLEHGRKLSALSTSLSWAIGDWVNVGTKAFGEKYREAEQVSGYDVQSLMNMAYVASRVSPERRRFELTWSHHAEVASLGPDDQNRWLAHAIDNRMSVRKMRDGRRRERLASRTASAEAAGATGGTDETTVSAPPQLAVSKHCPHCGHSLTQ